MVMDDWAGLYWVDWVQMLNRKDHQGKGGRSCPFIPIPNHHDISPAQAPPAPPPWRQCGIACIWPSRRDAEKVDDELAACPLSFSVFYPLRLAW